MIVIGNNSEKPTKRTLPWASGAVVVVALASIVYAVRTPSNDTAPANPAVAKPAVSLAQIETDSAKNRAAAVAAPLPAADRAVAPTSVCISMGTAAYDVAERRDEGLSRAAADALVGSMDLSAVERLLAKRLISNVYEHPELPPRAMREAAVSGCMKAEKP
jgi:hypothetical protein